MPADVDVVKGALNADGQLEFKLNGSKLNRESAFGSATGRVEVDHFVGKINVKRYVRAGSSVIPNFRNFTITASASAVVLNEVSNSAADGVFVVFEDDSAAYGIVSPGGWLYSESFSGCVWFLFRDINNRVHGVHGARATGVLADPRDYYKSSGAKLLYVFDSMGRMFPKERKDLFIATLCHVGRESITCWAVARDSQNKVVEILDQRTIPNWRRYELPSPVIRVTQSRETPPAKSDLFSKLKRLVNG